MLCKQLDGYNELDVNNLLDPSRHYITHVLYCLLWGRLREQIVQLIYEHVITQQIEYQIFVALANPKLYVAYPHENCSPPCVSTVHVAKQPIDPYRISPLKSGILLSAHDFVWHLPSLDEVAYRSFIRINV